MKVHNLPQFSSWKISSLSEMRFQADLGPSVVILSWHLIEKGYVHNLVHVVFMLLFIRFFMMMKGSTVPLHFTVFNVDKR